MYKSTIRWGRRGAVLRAISTIDMALWDIKGKIFGIPLYLLLGGEKKKIAVYASSGYYCGLEGKEDEQFIKNDCLSIKEKGFKYYKLRVGGGTFENDLRRVKIARETLGNEIGIYIDANNAWDVLTTIKFCKEIEELKIDFFEEPILHDNILDLKKIVENVKIPIAVGELESTRWGFQNIIDYKAADILQPDVTVVGGVTELVKVVNIAIAQGFTVMPHAFPEWHLHLACALPEVNIIEYFDIGSDIINIEKIFKTFPEAKNGYLECPDKPGLGFEIDEEKVRGYKILQFISLICN